MNWEAIGAVGEILGAAAVFVTLIFLVIQLRHLAEQTRQNTLAMQFASYGSHAETLSQFQTTLAMDEGLSDVWFRCSRAEKLGDESIEEKDWFRYSVALRAVFVMHEDLYYQYEQGMLDHSYWEHRCQFLAATIAGNAVVAGWWKQEETANVYVPGFIDAINNTEITIGGEYLDKQGLSVREHPVV